MPRRTKTPLLEPIRAYYIFERKRAIAEEKQLEQRARKRRARVKSRLERKAERDMAKESRMNREIDRIEKHPSKLAVSLLRDMVRSTTAPGAIKARAGALILQWTAGDFNYDKRKRPRRKA